MREANMHFKMEHLDRYAIIEKPCTIIVKNNSKLDYDKLYDPDGTPRWLMNIKAITKNNLLLLKKFSADNVRMTYYDMGHLLMKAAIWPEQVIGPMDLPVKGEEVIATFGFVDEILMCTGVTLIPRIQPDLYLHSVDTLDEINKLEKIIKDMRDE